MIGIEMEHGGYENIMLNWRETLVPNPQRGRCICFRTYKPLDPGRSRLVSFFSIPFDFFGDGGGDVINSSYFPVVEEGLLPFYISSDSTDNMSSSSTLTSVGSSLFVVGGTEYLEEYKNSITTKKMSLFDTTAPDDGWKVLSMSTPRLTPGTIAMDGKLYIIGGGYYPLAELFDPCLKLSKSVPLPPPPNFPICDRHHMVIAALHPYKKILVASALSSDVAPSLYNVVDQVWEELDHKVDFSSFRGQAAVVRNGTTLCLCNYPGEVHAYDLVLRRWFKSPIKGFGQVGMLHPQGWTYYCPLVRLDDNHLCFLWEDHTHYDSTILPVLNCTKIGVSISVDAVGESRFDAFVVASRSYVLGPRETIFDAHVFLGEEDEAGGERGSGVLGGDDHGGRTWEHSGYGGGATIALSIARFKTCSKCWFMGHVERDCTGIPCFKCGEIAHKAIDCPTGG